jgi:hypothetical protein
VIGSPQCENSARILESAPCPFRARALGVLAGIGARVK